jgi:hypothetical protein
MNVVRDITKPGRPEDTLRHSWEHYGPLVELSPDTVIQQASGRSPYANAVGAKLRSPSGTAPRQTFSELCTSLPLGDGVLLTHVWQERKGAGSCEEKQLR